MHKRRHTHMNVVYEYMKMAVCSQGSESKRSCVLSRSPTELLAITLRIIAISKYFQGHLNIRSDVQGCLQRNTTHGKFIDVMV